MNYKLMKKTTNLLLILLVFTTGINPNTFITPPYASIVPTEYDGCLTFGDQNYNGIDYNVTDEPFDQLYSYYHNGSTGFGIIQNNEYPFSGTTEIIGEKDGHLNVLESDAVENGYFEGYNIPDSPSSGNQSIEFYWAWETINTFDYGSSPKFLVQTDNGIFSISMKTHLPHNRWWFISQDNSTSNVVDYISAENVSNTINENEFFRVQIEFDLDNNDVTYTINGDISVTATLSIPYTIGKIQFISLGTSHSYFDKHWIDSISWTWDSEYEEGGIWDHLTEYEGCLTFGDQNYNKVDYNATDEPFDQLYSYYHNGGTGYGIIQNIGYPFLGTTKIVGEKAGHLNVLESDAQENGYYEGYDIPDSPSTGNQSIEFWWAWETINTFDYGPSPKFLVQTDNGIFSISMKTHDPHDHWWFISQDNSSSNTVDYISTETTSDTINTKEFFYVQIAFDLDNDNVTYTIIGDITVTKTLSIPYTIGKIQFISLGTSHSYFDKHWIDSLSWTWDSEYEEGDLLETKTMTPDPPILNTINPNPTISPNIMLEWNEVDYSDYYSLYRYSSLINDINGSVTKIGTTSSTIYYDSVAWDKEYYYAVTANNEYGSSAISNCESVTVDLPSPDDPILLEIIPNPDEDGNVLLDWNDIDYADNYTVYRHSSFITGINGSLTNLGTTFSSSHSDIGLSEGTYYYVVIAKNETGISNISNCENVVIDIPGPDTPILDPIDPSTSTNGIINLEWNDIEFADSYSIYRYTSPITEINGSVSILGVSLTSEFTDHVFTEEIFYYAVMGVNGTGISSLSNCEVVTVDFPGPDTPSLEPIDPFTSTNGVINLDWNDIEYVDSYSIYRHTSLITEINGSISDLGVSFTSEFTDHLFSEDMFYYAILAVNGTGISGISNCEVVTVDFPGPDSPILDPIDPSTSINGVINLDWNDIDYAESYSIYRYASPITEINGSISDLGVTLTSEFTDYIFSEDVFYYAVLAVNGTGISGISNCEVVIVDFPGPDSPILDPIDPSTSTDGIINLNWNDIEYADNYTIYRHTSYITELNGTISYTIFAESNSYIDSISSEGIFYYVVVAYNDTGISGISNCVAVTVDLPPPMAPVLDPITPNPDIDGIITLSWNYDPDVSFYRIYRDTTPISDISGHEYIGETDQSHFTDEGLTNGNFYYVIVAFGPGGQSNLSNTQEVVVELPKEIPGYGIWSLIGFIGVTSLIILLRFELISKKK